MNQHMPRWLCFHCGPRPCCVGQGLRCVRWLIAAGKRDVTYGYRCMYAQALSFNMSLNRYGHASAACACSAYTVYLYIFSMYAHTRVWIVYREYSMHGYDSYTDIPVRWSFIGCGISSYHQNALPTVKTAKDNNPRLWCEADHLSMHCLCKNL